MYIVIRDSYDLAIFTGRRDLQTSKVHGELRRLSKAYRRAPEEEKPPLEQLRTDLRVSLKSLHRVENLHKKSKEQMRKRAQFISNPFQFFKRLLGDKRSGRLVCPKEEVEEYMYLRRTHSVPHRDKDLGECEKLLSRNHHQKDWMK